MNEFRAQRIVLRIKFHQLMYCKEVEGDGWPEAWPGIVIRIVNSDTQQAVVCSRKLYDSWKIGQAGLEEKA